MSCTDKENILANNKNSSETFTTIYLLRHGQTIGNAARIYLDPAKEILSPKGRLQAFAVGKHLSRIKFDRAYASSLVRAKETAKIILDHSKSPLKQPIRFDERIKEVDHGIFRGRSYDETQKIRGKNVCESYPYKSFYVEGTEDLGLVLLRLHSFLNDLFETLDKSIQPETILIVSHGTLIRILMKYLKLNPDKFCLENFSNSLYTKYLKNTAYHKFQIERRSPNSKSIEPRLIRFWESHRGPHLEKCPRIS